MSSSAYGRKSSCIWQRQHSSQMHSGQDVMQRDGVRNEMHPSASKYASVLQKISMIGADSTFKLPLKRLMREGMWRGLGLFSLPHRLSTTALAWKTHESSCF